MAAAVSSTPWEALDNVARWEPREAVSGLSRVSKEEVAVGLEVGKWN